jgi:hypothetical protein
MPGDEGKGHTLNRAAMGKEVDLGGNVSTERQGSDKLQRTRLTMVEMILPELQSLFVYYCV